MTPGNSTEAVDLRGRRVDVAGRRSERIRTHPVATSKNINRENRFRARIVSSDTLYNTGIQTTVGINFEPR